MFIRHLIIWLTYIIVECEGKQTIIFDLAAVNKVNVTWILHFTYCLFKDL
jgi:hypothetical protein